MKTTSDEVPISASSPGSLKPAKSNFACWPSRNALNHGHAGVPIAPSATAKNARIASGIVITRGLSCACPCPRHLPKNT